MREMRPCVLLQSVFQHVSVISIQFLALYIKQPQTFASLLLVACEYGEQIYKSAILCDQHALA